jgi:hypothetical protein
MTDERQRRLMRAARRIAQIDTGGQRVIGNEASEQIGRNAADEPAPIRHQA